jgi:hypothetical protein
LQCVAVDEFQGLINRLPVREATNTEATQHHEKAENKMPAAALCDSIIWNQIQKGWCRMAVLLSHLHCLGGRLMIVIKSALCLRRVARRNALLHFFSSCCLGHVLLVYLIIRNAPPARLLFYPAACFSLVFNLPVVTARKILTGFFEFLG